MSLISKNHLSLTLQSIKRLLSNKADKDELSSKADKSELSSKADRSELSSKADRSELSSKADRSEVEAALELKMNASNKYVIKVFGGAYGELTNYAGSDRPYHGSCTLIHGAGQSFLFDLGAINMKDCANKGLNIPLIQYMSQNVTKPLTAVFISHFHEDHYHYNNINYLRTQGWIDSTTMVVFPSAPNLPPNHDWDYVNRPNLSSRGYINNRGYLIDNFKDQLGTFNYRTSREPAYILPGYSSIAAIKDGYVVNIDDENVIEDGEVLNFGDVSIECYNVDAGIPYINPATGKHYLDASYQTQTYGKYSQYTLDCLGKTTQVVPDKHLNANGEVVDVVPSSVTIPLHRNGNYNAYSMINVVNIQGQRIVFTGDMVEPSQEAYAHVLTEPADLMFVPHHGLETFISHSLLNRLNSRYAVEHTIYSIAWRETLCNVFTGELVKNGCCALYTKFDDIEFEIENFKLRKTHGGTQTLCPNVYAACALKQDQDLTELPAGDYLTYDSAIAEELIVNNNLSGLINADGTYPTFSVSVKPSAHGVPYTGYYLKQITVTSHGTTQVKQAVKTSIGTNWSDWMYATMTPYGHATVTVDKSKLDIG